ncbi:MAG: Membrane protein, distant similarity to thiosulfate:quinone oxidoreductase DoxD [Ktedonobacterales bacterium]|nr:MAG: Membrane protein, distant similarity to thiosulfate:quinone oxidoreductase DoxD [Ktedonobacterales bacterium]
MALALLILRLALGLSFIGHGTQKLFGWFGGAGFAVTAKNYENKMGMRPGWLFALLGGGGEAGGGLLLALGLFTPLGALLIIATMVVAIVQVTGRRGYWVGKGGWEYNALIIAVCVALMLTGPGAYALDHALGLNTSLASALHLAS